MVYGEVICMTAVTSKYCTTNQAAITWACSTVVARLLRITRFDCMRSWVQSPTRPIPRVSSSFAGRAEHFPVWHGVWACDRAQHFCLSPPSTIRESIHPFAYQEPLHPNLPHVHVKSYCTVLLSRPELERRIRPSTALVLASAMAHRTAALPLTGRLF